ncbi:DUF6447 family protein [Roseospira goensis]|uniref:Isocitrate lyase n=1 Tax=Roseospira goensis TaxID=391922 RepID=A0A7W6WLA0_9PROT|nr:DUF6447 family protein [Roseospira goensis]MBB4286468.1 isocitrate lyase [Roseospira goensis]
MAEQQTVTIDGKDYPLDSLSEKARGLIQALRTADQEIARAQAQAAMFQVARGSYATALKQELEGAGGA